jgi:hypothetical protein
MEDPSGSGGTSDKVELIHVNSWLATSISKHVDTEESKDESTC